MIRRETPYNVGRHYGADIERQVRAWSGDPWDWPYLAKIIDRVPKRFRERVGEWYVASYGRNGQQGANTWIRECIADRLTDGAVSLAASDVELCDYAAARVAEVGERMALWVPASADVVAGKLRAYADRHRATLPEGATLQGIVCRMTDAGWWRRQVRRVQGREVEGVAIALGMVHRREGIYASDESVSRHGEQVRRNRLAMEETEAENEAGDVFRLAELVEKGVSSPAIRRAELMTRVKGFEDFAKAMEHEAVFVTWTCPSRMHARLSRSGEENQSYDGTTPREAQRYLARCFAAVRAKLNRAGVYVYGLRVAEPHHDGTPHWHMLLFMARGAVRFVVDTLRRYACREDAAELSSPVAMQARFKVQAIDWSRGSAVGYVAKYIGKNVDGRRADGSGIGDDDENGKPATETADRVRAWASTWGIRQFQQVGGPAVGVWRELRRIKENPQGELFPAWSAADVGNWHAYVEAQGGIAVKRSARPVKIWRLQEPGRMTKYQEPAPSRVAGVECAGRAVESRVHTWTLRRCLSGKEEKSETEKSECWQGSVQGGGVEKGIKSVPWGLSRVQIQRKDGVGDFDVGPEAPWTRVNNCTGGMRYESAGTNGPGRGCCAAGLDGGPGARQGNRCAVHGAGTKGAVAGGQRTGGNPGEWWELPKIDWGGVIWQTGQ